jgi:hypothetical protein
VAEQTAAALDSLAAAPLAGPAGDAIRVLARRALTPAAFSFDEDSPPPAAPPRIAGIPLYAAPV